MDGNRSFIFDVHDILLGFCQAIRGVVYFDLLPKRTMLQAVEKIPDEELDSHYNNIPTIREFIGIAEAYKYGGYIINPPREDSRVVIDALYIPDYVDHEIIASLKETAQECKVVQSDNQKLWYFRWI